MGIKQMNIKTTNRKRHQILPLLSRLLYTALLFLIIATASSQAQLQESSETKVRMPKLADSNMANELISVNFDKMEIRDIIKTVSDITGINFIVDDSVQGTVTVMSPAKIRLADLYEFLQSILEVKGFAAVPAGNLVKIVPRAEALKRSPTVRTSAEASEIPAGDSIATQIISLEYADVAEVSQIIKPLLSNGSQMSTYAKTNTILITDTSSNISHVAKVIQKLDLMAKQLDIERPRQANNVHVVYLKNATAKETAQSLNQALANLKISSNAPGTNYQPVSVSADEGTNALIITATTQDFSLINQIIEKLDIVRESVLVEMLIVEVSQDSLREIGIDWSTLDQAVEGSVRLFGGTNFGVREGFVAGDLEGLAVGAWKKNGTETTIGPILQALDKVSGVNILSTPHILTSNHHKAKIIVGENIPYVMQSRITETEPQTPTVIKTFEYKDVGIMLEITPHISQGGLVRLEIDSQFTKLVESVSTASNDTPTTAKREAQTVVSMNNGSTVVIGGLIRDDKVTVLKKIPLVGDIPVLGGLFQWKKDQVQKTNLLIFLTPHIVASQQELDKLTEQKKQQMESAATGINGDNVNFNNK